MSLTGLRVRGEDIVHSLKDGFGCDGFKAGQVAPVTGA
jgi:hypothetical protein